MLMINLRLTYFECTNRTNCVPRRIIYNYYYNLLKQKEHYNNICASVFEKKRKSEKKKIRGKMWSLCLSTKKYSSVSRLFCICTSFCWRKSVGNIISNRMMKMLIHIRKFLFAFFSKLRSEWSKVKVAFWVVFFLSSKFSIF